jgi:putative ABC transport system ATP-binding protein
MIIELNNVTKMYGQGATKVEALRGIDLNINRGEFVSVMGPSGSGKSTLLHLLSALDAPSSGTIKLDGKDIAAMDDDSLTLFRRHHVGLVFQFFNLLPTLDAFENVMLPVLLERKERDADSQRALELLTNVGLRDRAKHRIHELSGGEMQRVAIARALILSPPIILADEPTGNLDTNTGLRILNILRDVCKHEGTTVVMVTHDSAAAAIGDRVVNLRDGRIQSDLATLAKLRTATMEP